MTVVELIKALEQFPPNLPVMVSDDRGRKAVRVILPQLDWIAPNEEWRDVVAMPDDDQVVRRG